VSGVSRVASPESWTNNMRVRGHRGELEVNIASIAYSTQDDKFED